MRDDYQVPSSDGLVKRAVIAETLSPGGMINSYCTYLYNVSIQRAKGYGVLRSLLDNIAVSDEPMNQSELARRLKMTQGAVRGNLNELVAVGVLYERERRYYYTDPVLRYRVAYVQNGIEVSEFPTGKGYLLPRWGRGKCFHQVTGDRLSARQDLEWVASQKPEARKDPYPWRIHFITDAGVELDALKLQGL